MPLRIWAENEAGLSLHDYGIFFPQLQNCSASSGSIVN
jgi:hypothetical protein